MAMRVEGIVASGDAVGLTDPVYIGGKNPSGDLTELNLDATGRLSVTPEAAGAKTVYTEDSLALAAGATDTIDTPDLAVSQDLVQVRVGGTDSLRYSVWVVNNGTETLVAGPFYSFFGTEETWDVKEGTATVPGGTGGLDAFRVKLQNDAKNKPADYNVTICYRES